MIVFARLGKNFSHISGKGFRCLYPKDDYNLIYGAWNNFSYIPDCDIVEISCNKSKTFKNFYRYIHTQIYTKKK